MSSILLNCPSCQEEVQAPVDLLGTTQACCHCQHSFQLPHQANFNADNTPVAESPEAKGFDKKPLLGAAAAFILSIGGFFWLSKSEMSFSETVYLSENSKLEQWKYPDFSSWQKDHDAMVEFHSELKKIATVCKLKEFTTSGQRSEDQKKLVNDILSDMHIFNRLRDIPEHKFLFPRLERNAGYTIRNLMVTAYHAELNARVDDLTSAKKFSLIDNFQIGDGVKKYGVDFDVSLQDALDERVQYWENLCWRHFAVKPTP